MPLRTDLFPWVTVAVHTQDVVRDPPVVIWIHLIEDDEDEVEPGEK